MNTRRDFLKTILAAPLAVMGAVTPPKERPVQERIDKLLGLDSRSTPFDIRFVESVNENSKQISLL